MKIAVNATIVDPSSSGLGMYAMSITRELVRLHPDVLVYTSAPEFFDEDGIEVHQVTSAVRASRGFRGHITRVLWSQLTLPKQLRMASASVLLSPTPLEAVMRAPIPQVVVVHDLLPIRFPESYGRQKYYYRHLLPRILSRSQAIVAVSETTKTDLINLFGLNADEVAVIYNGCDHDRFKTGGQASDSSTFKLKRPFLLYVGNLFPHKNLERLLLAFSSIADWIEHQLVIVGFKDPRYHPVLEKKVRTYGVESRVSLLDYVPSEMLPEMYRRADWFVLPSLFEGFGMTPLESMACGTPVIVSRTPALEEIVGEAGVFFDAKDTSDMAEKISRSCLDRSLRQVKAEQGVRRASEFSWDKTALGLLEVITRASKISGGHPKSAYLGRSN